MTSTRHEALNVALESHAKATTDLKKAIHGIDDPGILRMVALRAVEQSERTLALLKEIDAFVEEMEKRQHHQQKAFSGALLCVGVLSGLLGGIAALIVWWMMG